MANSFGQTGETPKTYQSNVDSQSEFAAANSGEIL